MLANVIKIGMTKILIPTEASMASLRFMEVINSRNIHQVIPKTNIHIVEMLKICKVYIILEVLYFLFIVYFKLKYLSLVDS